MVVGGLVPSVVAITTVSIIAIMITPIAMCSA